MGGGGIDPDVGVVVRAGGGVVASSAIHPHPEMGAGRAPVGYLRIVARPSSLAGCRIPRRFPRIGPASGHFRGCAICWRFKASKALNGCQFILTILGPWRRL